MATELQQHLMGTTRAAVEGDLEIKEIGINTAATQKELIANLDDVTYLHFPSLERLDDTTADDSGATLIGVESAPFSVISGSDVQAVLESIDSNLSGGPTGVLLRNGTTTLTGNWDTGDFDIIFGTGRGIRADGSNNALYITGDDAFTQGGRIELYGEGHSTNPGHIILIGDNGGTTFNHHILANALYMDWDNTGAPEIVFGGTSLRKIRKNLPGNDLELIHGATDGVIQLTSPSFAGSKPAGFLPDTSQGEQFTVRGNAEVIDFGSESSEYLSDTGFSTGTPWAVADGFSISGGKALFSSTDGSGTLEQLNANMVTSAAADGGQFFKLVYTVGNATGTFTLTIETTTAQSQVNIPKTNGTHTVYFRAASAISRLQFGSQATGTASFDLDSVSMKKISGGDLIAMGGAVRTREIRTDSDYTILTLRGGISSNDEDKIEIFSKSHASKPGAFRWFSNNVNIFDYNHTASDTLSVLGDTLQISSSAVSVGNSGHTIGFNNRITFNAGASTASTTDAQGENPIPETRNIEFITVNNVDDASTLPAAANGRPIILHLLGGNQMKLYPKSGDSINGGAANSPITIAGDSMWIGVCNGSSWRGKAI